MPSFTEQHEGTKESETQPPVKNLPLFFAHFFPFTSAAIATLTAD